MKQLVYDNLKSLMLSAMTMAFVAGATGCGDRAAPEVLAAGEQLVEMTAASASAANITPTVKESTYIELSSMNDLNEFIDHSPHKEEYRKGIIPAVARTDIGYAEVLVNNPHHLFLIVDKGRMKVVLYSRYGEKLDEIGMCCGRNYGNKRKKGDMRTPEGIFKVVGVFDSTEWLFTDDNGYTSPKKGQYGPRFIRLSVPGGGIGIHGTGAPWSIGHRLSHGCIRVTNENILHLADIVEKDMPVIVSPGSRDVSRNLKEGVVVPRITTGS